MKDLFKKAEQLVKERIPGTRKGMSEPAYEHSFRVSAALEDAGYSEEVCLAGLLHDVVEDGEVTFEELLSLGFSPRVVDIVRLCTHDLSVKGSDERWTLLMAGLVRAQDAEAWAVKIADVTDNLRSSEHLVPERRDFMRTVKGPLIVSLTTRLLAETKLWNELQRMITSFR